jgi:predicted CopG family antitoxin
VKAHKREGESFSDALDRLIDERPFTELAGILTDAEAESYRRAIREANDEAETDLDDVVSRL